MRRVSIDGSVIVGDARVVQTVRVLPGLTCDVRWRVVVRKDRWHSETKAVTGCRADMTQEDRKVEKDREKGDVLLFRLQIS